MQLSYVDVLLIVLPALTILFTLWHHTRIVRGTIPAVRPLAGMAELDARLTELIEAGRPVHIALGASQPGRIGPTAETLASLMLAQRVAETATRRGGNVITTSGDAVTDLAVRGALRQAYRQTELAGEYHSARAQVVAQQTPIAYASGVVRRYATEPMDFSVVAGDYGSEVLLIAEEGAQRGLPHIAGATTFTALPALVLSTDATLIGEELFAAEAYLSGAAASRARLRTQDALRGVVVLLIVLGAIYQALNVTLALGLPSL